MNAKPLNLGCTKDGVPSDDIGFEENESIRFNSTLFSVLIANYNNGQYLEECLQSIFAQTYKNWEIVIVDDASTDDSNNIYEKFSDDERVTVIVNRKNKGCGYTKRKCVEIARGEICGFVDADDALSHDALELMIRYHLDNPGFSIIYSTHYVCDQNLTPKEIADYVGQIPNHSKSCWTLRPVISHFASFKRVNYLNTKGISPIYHKAADKDLYYKLEDTGPVLFIDKPLYFYRHHLNSISLNQHATAAYQYELMAKAMVALRHNNKSILEQMPYTKDALTKGILYVALKEFRNKHLCSASKLFFQSSYFSPITSLKLIISRIFNTWK